MNTLFFRLLDSEDKATPLSEAVGAIREGRLRNAVAHVVDPVSFRQVPGAPFAYWVSERLRNVFTSVPPLEGSGRVAVGGMKSGQDERFVRTSWEVSIGSSRYRGFAKGGSFSPFYADVHLVVDWLNDGRQSLAFYEANRAVKGGIVRNPQYYFRPGLTWPRRTNGFSLRVMPAGCIFADKGPAVFVEGDNSEELLALAAVTNSSAFGLLVSLQLARTELAQSYEVGLMQKTPIPELSPMDQVTLATLAHRAWSLTRALDAHTENSHAFTLPALLLVAGMTLAERAVAWVERVRRVAVKLAAIQAEIDAHCFDLYSITEADRRAITKGFGTSSDGHEPNTANEDDSEDDENATAANVALLTAAMMSWAVGITFGRFDVCLAIGERALPPAPDPFAPLPVCPPGQLQNEQGLPISRKDVTRLQEEGRWDYPIEIPWAGILVDDPGHPLDIETRVQQVLRLIWKDRWEDIEQEACEILGVRTLRDYFRKPAGFFADHLKRYSKSRRKAPIYWSLQTSSGSYTLWLYYHRLNDQTLYTCVNDFVEKSKLREVTEQLHVLRAKTSRSKQEEKDLERLLDLEQELKDFRDELLRVAQFWKPNLNDGVQITAAPLWKLFQHKPWQNTLKDTWEKLEKGDYDWAHLAYSIWPDRVREKCRHDQSLAIAHGLEELYEAPPEQPKKKRGRARG